MTPKTKPSLPFRMEIKGRHPANPLLCAQPGTWEAEWFTVESVLEVGGEYRMYYCGSQNGNKNSKLGLAVSQDAVQWRRYEGNPIWERGWDHLLRDVRVYRFEGPEFWLYYSDYDFHLDLARSRDGIHWENLGQNPIMTPSQAWEDRIMQESVLKLGDFWRMWYSTYERKPRVTGTATSKDGIHWTKYEGNPVFLLGNPGEWDDYSAFQPNVFFQDGLFHMIYTGSSKANPTGYRTGYAWSKDGIDWTKSPENPVFGPGPAGSWDGGKVSCPTVLRTGPDTFNIYYSGASAPKGTYSGIGLVQARLHRMP